MMEMFEALRQHIARYIDLSEEDFARCTDFFIPQIIKKSQFFLQQGEVCRNMAFITRGCLRSYSIDADGEEHVVQIGIENWWMNDPYSYLTGEPSSYNIDALEDSEIC